MIKVLKFFFRMKIAIVLDLLQPKWNEVKRITSMDILPLII